MKYCRVTKKVVPPETTLCPHCHSDRCLGTFGVNRAPGPGPGRANEDDALQLTLRSLENRVHAGRRRGAWLAAGAALALIAGGLTWGAHHVSTVMAYAELDPNLRLERDPSDPDRLTILFRPTTAGRIGFRRSDHDRETELLDHVASSQPGDQKLEWRWTGVKQGDKLRVTHRRGWTLNHQELAIPKPPPPSRLGDAVLVGEVVDATSNAPLRGASVRIIGTDLQATTGVDGRFRLTDAPTGPVGIEVTASRFSTDQIERDLSTGAETSLRVALSPGMPAGQIRLVLTWGREPKDLDIHLEGPLPGGQRFHVFFGDKGDLKSRQFVSLDVDDLDGHGPETITVLGVLPGTYRCLVHNYSNFRDQASQALARSDAEVKVYQGGQAYRFKPNGESIGTLWHVCDIEVSPDGSATVRKVDQYGYVPVNSGRPR